MAGFRVVWASEFIPAAAEVYKANHPDSILDTRDIHDVTAEEILKATGLKQGEIDLFDGSPPCASFSTAGKRHKGWGKVRSYSDTEQRVDNLFFEYARILEGLQPRVFVGENVSGLVKGVAKGMFLEILERLKGCGYRVKCKLLDAQWLGVPQMRQRIIFLGVREDLNCEPVHPKPLPYRYSVSDAISCFKGSEVEAAADISQYCTGREWENLRQGDSSKKYFNLVKAHPEKPSGTICASHGSGGIASVTHPTEKRKFSIAELRRICGFPNDFQLSGTYAQQWERLGRAVPPVMMEKIAATIRDKILYADSK
jgi:DNA (cytosine-5)-methyltransferase 1